MAKQILFDEAGRQQLQAGIQKLAKVVGSTLGPGGRGVLLGNRFTKPRMTVDGNSVAREIELESPFENIGAKLVNEVAARTNKEAGDGTTTSVILAEAMIQEGNRFVVAGVSPIAIRNGMNLAAEKAVNALTKMARPIEGKRAIERVALNASGHDEKVASVVAEAMSKVGANGVVTVEKGEGVEPVLNYVAGLELDKGMVSPYFITNQSEQSAQLSRPRILITDQKISSIRDLVPILEKLHASRQPLLIIAEDVEGEALAGLLINRMRGALEVAAIKAPAFGDRRKALLEDLAVTTGGTFFTKDTGFEWESVDVDQLGSCERAEVFKDRTVIFKGQGDAKALENRRKSIRSQIEQTTSSYDKEKLEERLGRLEGKIAVIKVGGYVESQLDERKGRVEDALSATRAAMQEGVVPGGGAAFVHAIEAVRGARAKGDLKHGVEIVARALERPLQVIGNNAGLDGPALSAEVGELEEEYGYDVRSGKARNMFAAGVVDPLKVLRIGLLNAVSIASLNLVSDAVITDLPDGEEAVAGARS